MKRLLALLCLLLAFPLAAQPSKYSFDKQIRPGFGTSIAAEATTNLLGDTTYTFTATQFARLAGNITTTNKFKCQVGNGSISAAPGWCALVSGDIPANAANTSGTAAISTAATITNDATTAATMYPLWASANTGNLGLKTSSTKLSFRPDTGIFTATGFAGPLTGLASSATILATTRAINGVNFDGSAPITVTADANTLSGTTLKSTVLASSLTSVGTLAGLTVVDNNRAPSLTFGAASAFSFNTNTSAQVSFGQDAGPPYVFWMQSRFSPSGSKDIALNPLGGNIGIGAMSFGTSANTVLSIGNGTAPTSSPAGMVQLWAVAVSSSSELRVRDEAGNVTTLSPHNFSMFTPGASQAFPWSYYSKNAHIGKEMSVDMYGLAAEVEKLSGKQFIYVNDLPVEELEDWAAQEAAKKVAVEKQRKDKAMEAEIEVAVADAVEVVTITMSQPSATLTENVTKYVLDATTGKVKTETVTTPKMETIGTPETESRLKVGVRLDEKTGKFWRHIRADEAVVEPYVPKAPPAWMKDRMKVAVK